LALYNARQSQMSGQTGTEMAIFGGLLAVERLAFRGYGYMMAKRATLSTLPPVVAPDTLPPSPPAAAPRPVRVHAGVELNENLPDPVSGFGYFPNTLDKAATENALYSHITAYQAELRLANRQVQEGNVVVKYGDRIGAQGNDVVSVNPRTGEVTMLDSKYRSTPETVTQSPTYANSATRDAARAEAETFIANSPQLSSEAKTKALNNIRAGNFTTVTSGSGKAVGTVVVKYCGNQPC
jgi:filamentous hemagglutinin